MIDQSKQSATLKVCLEDAGTHNRAILDFFFAKLGQHIFRCVETQEKATVLLIDYDFPPARQRFENEYQQWQKPALILSISEVSIENSIWLSKPLTSRALLDAAGTLQKQMVNPAQAPTAPANLPLVDKFANGSPSELKSEGEASDVASVPTQDAEANVSEDDLSKDEQPTQELTTEAEKNERVLRLCGDSEDIDLKAALSDDFHHEDSFFLSSLKDAVRLARQCQQGVLLNFPKAKIYVLPEIHRIFCGIDIADTEFTDLISTCNVKDGGKMHILSTPEIHELNDMISQQASALHDLESFVWTSTLLSAQGRLPRALNPKKAVGLKHWPSLTRLESFPYALPIAAQWSAAAMSATEVAQSLNIPQRYVFSFYNAANSLGLIEQDPEKLISKQSVPRSKDAPRGLFSRLLKRLVGGQS